MNTARLAQTATVLGLADLRLEAGAVRELVTRPVVQQRFGFDTDTELLEMITTGEIRATKVGHYLESLRSRFPAVVMADMVCLMQVHLELSIRAKGLLLAREAGLPAPVGRDVRANLDE